MNPNLNPELLIYSGLPASGKTSAAFEWVAEDPTHRSRVNYDDLRIKLFGSTWRFNWEDEARMKKEADDITRTYLEGGYSVVIDNTNLTEHERNHWTALGESCGASIAFQDFDTSTDVCIQRDKIREKRVGRAVIEWMALSYGFLDLNNRDEYPNDFIICDVDGTLADGSHRKHFVEAPEDVGQFHKLDCSLLGKCLVWPYIKDTRCKECGGGFRKDWYSYLTRCADDAPIEPIFEALKRLSGEAVGSIKYDILVVSGRPIDLCGIATEDWLDRWFMEHGMTYRHLFMRRNGKFPDYEVKQAILDLLPKERIKYVLDDRASVCNQTWRANGLTCLQVAEGNF